MADVNVFDYVTGRLDVLREELGKIAESHSDLRVTVSSLQTQLRIVYAVLFALMTGLVSSYFHLIRLIPPK